MVFQIVCVKLVVYSLADGPHCNIELEVLSVQEIKCI